MWHERSTKPFNILKLTFKRYKARGRKEATKGINNAYKALQERPFKKVDFYQEWIEKNEKEIYDLEDLAFKPFISVITPVYNTNEKYLEMMIESVLKQTYTNWELCIADDASNNETLQTLKRYSELSKNIHIVYRDTNGHISEASNSALSLAKGEYVVLLDHDDMLAPNALYEMVKKLNDNRRLKLIYSDEDKIDEKNKRFDPHFKSGWNPDMFFSQNYICHLVLLKKSIVETIGGFRKGYEGSQDYDLLLRYIKEIDGKEIDRIEKILYHWRAIEGSTALQSDQKDYTEEAGLKALEDFFSVNSGITVEKGLAPNTYKVNYPLPTILPLVSIIIPTCDGYEILKQCIESILEKTTYTSYEILIVDNQTTDIATLNYLETLKNYKNINILKYNHPFNYSSINNYAVSKAHGEYILLLNNDIEVISPNWIQEMLQHAIRNDIGVVGAKLYYPDMTIQHAGVILGIGGVAGHSHKYFEGNDYGYFSRLKIIQNYSAVTGACMLVSKDIFKEVGGLSEGLAVAFNDVDFCLKVQTEGYNNLWTPYAQLFHHESKTRGAENTLEKVYRFNQEVKFMMMKWNKELLDDIYYNKNLSKKQENFSINNY